MKLIITSIIWTLASVMAYAQDAIPAAPGASAIGSPTYVNVGSMSADVLNWVVSITLPIVGAVITGWLTRVFQQVGISMSDAQRSRLQEIVVNGINVGAHQAEAALKGAAPIAVKNQAIAHAVEYVQQHGADTLKALGFDPHDAKTVQAIQARVLTAIADPATPTPPALDAKANPPPAS